MVDEYDFSAPSKDDLKQFEENYDAPSEAELAAFEEEYNKKEESHSLSDLGQGALQGATLGFVDEIGAAGQTLLDRFLGGASDVDKQLAEQGFTGDLTPTSTDVYRQASKENLEDYKEAQERSPVLTTLGEIGGGIATAIPAGGAGLGLGAGKVALKELLKTGGKAAVAKQLAKGVGKGALVGGGIGGTMGAGMSEGSVVGTPEEQAQLLEDVKSGMKSGAVFGGALKGVGDVAGPTLKKAAQKINPLKLLKTSKQRALKKAYSLGKEGVDLTDEAQRLGYTGQESVLDKIDKPLKDIVKRMTDVDEQLGKAVGSSLDDAAKAGVKINVGDDVNQAVSKFMGEISEIPDVRLDKDFGKIITDLLINKPTEISPKAAKTMLSNVDILINQIRRKVSQGQVDYQKLDFLVNFRKGIDSTLKTQVPGYETATARMMNFRDQFMKPLFKGYAGDVSSFRYGDIKPKERSEKLYNQLSRITKNLVASEKDTFSEEAFRGLGKGMKSLDAEDLTSDIVKKLNIDKPQTLLEELRDIADTQSVKATTSQTATLDPTVHTLRGTVRDTMMSKGEKLILEQANKLGVGKGILGGTYKTISDMSKAVYNAPPKTLNKIGSVLANSDVPGVKDYGVALMKGLESGNKPAQNAALFVIMQDPKARKLLGKVEK